MRPVFLSIALLSLAACGGASTAATPASGVDDSIGGESPEPTSEASAGDASEQTGSASASGKPRPEDEAFQLKDGADNEFGLHDAEASGRPGGLSGSQIKASRTHAAVRFVVINREGDKAPIPGVVVTLTAPNGDKFFTGETDMQGFAEVLVPVGQKYDLVFLSLGRKEIAARLPISDEPNQNIKLTLRYKRINAQKPGDPKPAPPRLVLEGVHFDTNKADLRDESFDQLDSVAEFMEHKPSARIEISGHTDNVGNAKRNKALSKRRAEACRDYLVAKGIDPGRIEAVGYGDERPIASNDSAEGRQLNRRIEASEL